MVIYRNFGHSSSSMYSQRPLDTFIQELCQKCITQDQMYSIKRLFRAEINSIRLFNRIITIEHLIYVLQQRDCLWEGNIEPLIKICRNLCDNTLFERLTNFGNIDGSSEPIADGNVYASERIRDITRPQRLIDDNIAKSKVPSEPTSAVSIGQLDDKKRDAVYKLIAGEIGRMWREFGRNLGLKEGDMDDLDSQFPRDFKSKVYGMFKMFEELDYVDPKRHVIIIAQALEESRRNDLRRKMYEILTL